MSEQPKWKILANLGDEHPIDHGGFFVFKDETGVYEEEAELLIVNDEGRKIKWEVFRFSLDRCTFIDGILSDNKYHPEHPAWFADDIAGMACEEIPKEKLIEMFCSADPLERAMAYQDLSGYLSPENLDGYPLDFTSRKEVVARYKDALAELRLKKTGGSK